MIKSQLYLCPGCGNKTTITFSNIISAVEEIIDSPTGESIDISYYYTLGQCATCHIALLFGTDDENEESENINTHQLLFPYQKTLPVYIPEELRKSYGEAKRVQQISPTAFTVLIRRAMEFLCDDQKAEGKNLNEKLSSLASKNIIPKTLAEMTTVLRILGNISAHASTITIDYSDVSIIDDFFNAILEYVYIAPYKLTTYKEKLKKYAK